MAKISEKHKRNLKLQAEAKLEKERNRILNLKGGFGLADHKPKPKVKVAPMYRNFEGRLPAKPDPVHVSTKQRVILSEEMQRREEIAQEEIKVKQSLVQPIFNKGAPQYLSGADLEDFCKGELRRR